jgi:protein ImuB
MRLFRDRLEKLHAGFGFENFVLSVLDAETLAPSQMTFSQSAPVDDESTFDALVDRLGMKLGFDEVNRVRVRESFLPERSVELRPAAVSIVAGAEWPVYRIRPIRLINPPMGIEVSILIPGEFPVQFFIGGRRHRVVRSEGPERLLGEWWMNNSSRPDRRDYYRVEDDQGLRFWIFRNSSDRWFLHGHLP